MKTWKFPNGDENENFVSLYPLPPAHLNEMTESDITWLPPRLVQWRIFAPFQQAGFHFISCRFPWKKKFLSRHFALPHLNGFQALYWLARRVINTQLSSVSLSIKGLPHWVGQSALAYCSVQQRVFLHKEHELITNDLKAKLHYFMWILRLPELGSTGHFGIPKSLILIHYFKL